MATSGIQHMLLPDIMIKAIKVIFIGSWTQVKKKKINFKYIPQCFTEANKSKQKQTTNKITIIKKLIFV